MRIREERCIMKKTKRTVLIIIAVAVLVCACVWLSFANSIIMSGLTSSFEGRLGSFDGIKIVEVQSVYGKLNGNGNGIGYFGAALVERRSVSDIDEVVNSLDDDFEIVEFKSQTTKSLRTKYLEHKNITFKTDIDGSDNYICIYFYNSNHPMSSPLDVSGH